MGMVTTHTEGRVVTHSGDDQRPVEVVLLPGRDEAAAAEQPAAPAKVATPATPATPAKASPAAKAAVKRQAARIKKGKK